MAHGALVPPVPRRFLEVRAPMRIWPWAFLVVAGVFGVGDLIDGSIKIGIVMIAVAVGPLLRALFNEPTITISDLDIVVAGPGGWEMAFEEIREVSVRGRRVLLSGEGRTLEFLVRRRDLPMVMREIESRRGRLRAGV